MNAKNKQITAAALIILLTTITIILWLFLNTLTKTTLQIYAIFITISLPATAWLFWWLGSTESRGYLKGIDGAITKMFHAITIAPTKPKPTTKQPNSQPNLDHHYLPQIHIQEDDSSKIINL